MALADKNAAIYIADAEADKKLLPTAVATVTDDEKINSLEENIVKLAKPNAAQEIAEEVLILADAYMEKETRRIKENLK